MPGTLIPREARQEAVWISIEQARYAVDVWAAVMKTATTRLWAHHSTEDQQQLKAIAGEYAACLPFDEFDEAFPVSTKIKRVLHPALRELAYEIHARRPQIDADIASRFGPADDI